MPFTLHFQDDTDDKPQQLSDEDALRVIRNNYDGEAMQERRWQELQRGEPVFVRAGRLVREGVPATGADRDRRVISSSVMEHGRGSSKHCTASLPSPRLNQPSQMMRSGPRPVTAQELRISFLRPLAAFTHWLDYRLWPNSSAWMNLHSIAGRPAHREPGAYAGHRTATSPTRACDVCNGVVGAWDRKGKGRTLTPGP